jgi:hypothetical protein
VAAERALGRRLRSRCTPRSCTGPTRSGQASTRR